VSPVTVVRAALSVASASASFPAFSCASASIIRASMPLTMASGDSAVGQMSCTRKGDAERSSRRFCVTPTARHATSPPVHTGTRGSPAVAKFTPFVPSPALTL
jgi:hypothetical protein